MAQLQGTIQGVHAGARVALPFMRFTDIAHGEYAVQPYRFPGLTWVDDKIVLQHRDDTRPIQGVLLNQRTYYRGILRVDVADRTIEHGSACDPQPLCSPTPEAIARHVGRVWVTDSPEEGEEVLAGSPEIPRS